MNPYCNFFPLFPCIKLNELIIDGIVFTILVVSRKFLSIFMVTYLPTLLINLIDQATNYIRAADKSSMIYTINTTCMMVLASIYLSVSASLPATSNIKPVEVWLLVNLAFPLIVMLTNIVLQVSQVLVKTVLIKALMLRE